MGYDAQIVGVWLLRRNPETDAATQKVLEAFANPADGPAEIDRYEDLAGVLLFGPQAPTTGTSREYATLLGVCIENPNTYALRREDINWTLLKTNVAIEEFWWFTEEQLEAFELSFDLGVVWLFDPWG